MGATPVASRKNPLEMRFATLTFLYCENMLTTL